MSESAEIVLTPAERALFKALDDLGVRYLVVGLSAAILEGASVTSQDIDVWFGSSAPWGTIGEAARLAGGFYTSGISTQRPAIGGPGLGRIDLVLTASGLGPFDEEYGRSKVYELEGVRLHVLPVDRVLASKRAADRPKDRAVIPNLEATVAAKRAREIGRHADRVGRGPEPDDDDPDRDRNSGRGR